MTGAWPTIRRRLIAVGVLISASSLTTCRLDDLLTPGEVGTIALAPAEVVDSAFAGSTAPRSAEIAVTVEGTTLPLQYAVVVEGGSAWIDLAATTGRAPGTFTVSADPTGLAAGDHVDTLRFTAEGPEAQQLRVPVRFRLLPCAVTDIAALPAQLTGALTTADCASPRNADRFARRYRFTAAANDTVTVSLTTSAFAPSVSIGREGVATPLIERASCSVATGACARYVLLPTAGNYIVEASSSTARATGAFDLVIGRPRPPTAPAALAQVSATTLAVPVAVGATIGTNQIAMQAALADPDLDSLRLEVEVRPIAAPYTGIASATSALTQGVATVTVNGLADGTAYRWRARTVDVTGRASAWTEFGGNATGATDFTISVPEAPSVPSTLVQRRTDDVTPIAAGGSTEQSIVRIGATLLDSDPGDQVRLEVEVRPVGTAFSNAATVSSAPVASGAGAMVTVIGLLDDVAYRWQARAVDASNRASAWVAFNGGGTAFRVAFPPARIVITQGPVSATAGAAMTPALRVEAQDASGNLLGSFAGTVTVALGANPATATLGGTLAVSAVDGIATFGDITVDRAGTALTLVASSGALADTSAAFNVVSSSAQQLEINAIPASVVAGSTIAPTVTVTLRDAFGNIATGFAGNVTLALATNAAGATLLGTTTEVVVNGVATFNDLRIARSGTALVLVASASGLADETSAPFNVVAATATNVRLQTAPSTTASSGVPFAQQPTVLIEDAFANRVLVAGITVSATITSGAMGATLTNALLATDLNGRVTFTGLTLTGPSGDYTLEIGSAGLVPVSVGPITIGAGAAQRLAIVAAPSASASSGTTFAAQPTVRLEDAAGNPVAQAGVAVTASLASGAGTLGGTTTVLTSAAGQAIFTDLGITGLVGARTLAFGASGLIGTTSGTIDITAGAATELALIAGDAQSTTAGSAVAIAPSVIARDASGNAVSGVPVAFAVVSGGGSITPTGTVSTGVTGVAALTSWTLGATMGINTITATSDGLAGSPITITATGTAGAASQLSITAGAALTGPVGSTLGTPLEVAVTDANGNPVAGVTVNWAATGGGSVAPAVSVTGADGRASTVRTLGPVAGAQGTTASATIGAGTSTVTFTASATVGGASQLALVAGDAQADTVGATLATPLSVIARDALNNPVAGVLITWSIVDGGGSVFPASATTNASGIATTQWTLGTQASPSDSTQLARASGVGTPVNFLATSRPGTVNAAQSLVVVAPISVAASRTTPATVTVTARDGFGNVVPGRTVTLAATGTGNAIVQPAALTSATGVTTGALGASVTGARTITATIGGVVATQAPTLTVVAAPAAQVVFIVPPTNSVAGAEIAPSPEVGVLDSLGNRNFTHTGAVTLALATNPAAGTLSGTLTRNAIAGVAAFPGLSVDRAAAGYALGASGTGLVGATSAGFDVTTGGISAARSLVAVAPASIVAGSATSTVTVTVLDANDNPVAGATVVIAATGTGNTLTQPVAVSDANGVATASVASTVTGTKTISATANGIALQANASVIVTPAPVSAALTTLTAVPPALTAGGTGSVVTVIARDAFGNRLSGATVSLSATGTGNTITQPVAATDTLGVATGAIGSTIAGVKTISATVNGVAITATVNVTVTSGVVSASQSIVSAEPATIVAGSGSSTVTVTARDANGNAVAGASVTIAATSGGNTVTQPLAVTDANGVTTGTVASTLAGRKQISAIVNAVAITRRDTIEVIAAAVSATQSTVAVTPPTIVAGTATSLVTVTARDAFGNVIAGAAVTLAATGAGNTITQPASTTDTNGVTTGALASTVSGAKLVTATIRGVAVTLGETVTVTAGPISAAQSTLSAAPATIEAGGVGSTVTVTARDANGNAVVGVTVALSATGTGNSITQPTAVTDANGSATGTVASTVAESKIITATVGGIAITQRDTITVTTGGVSAAQSTVAASPNSIVAGVETSTITVTARDASGNVIAGLPVVLASTGTGNTITQPLALTDLNGLTTGTLASTVAGSKVISVSIDGVAIDQTDTVAVTTGGVSATQSTLSAAPGSIIAGIGTSTITVTARDANGNVIAGATVLIAATGAGNTVTQPAGVTDANGVATGTVASTVTGPKTITATIGATAVTQSDTVTVTPGGLSLTVSALSASPSSIVAGVETSTLTVTARDANGNGIAGLAVVLAASGTGNTVTQPAAVTDATGVATGTLASTAAGAKIVSATIGAQAITQTDTVTVTSGGISAAQSTVDAAPDTIVAASGTSTITITARDANGNPVAGATVVLAASGAGNTLTQPAAVTGANGVTTGTLTSTVASDKIITATIGATPVAQTDTVTVTAGAVSAAQSTVSAAPGTIVAGTEASTITVVARDANGNAIAGAAVVLAASGTGNTLGQPALVTDASGVATGTLTSTVAAAKIVTATIGATAVTQSDTVAVIAGVVSAAQSTVSAAPASIAAGSGTSTITVTARDAFNNTIAGASVMLAASGSGNTVTQPASVTDATGVATGTLASSVAASKIVSATISGTPITQTDTVAVTAGGVSAGLSALSAAPATIIAGVETSTITVTARDANGNPIAGATVLLAATGAGNTVTQPGLTGADGIATGALASTAAGAKIVSATIDGTPVTQTVIVTVTPGVVSAAQSTLNAAPASIVAGSGTSTVTVTARDANGNPIAGATVLLAASGAGNTVTQPGAVTDATGVATGSVSSTVAAAKIISATIGAVGVTQTDTVTVTAAAISVAQSTVAVSASTIAAAVGATPVTVTVRDALNNGVPGATVVILATGTGNTITQPVGVTDANGVATGSFASTVSALKTISATADGNTITQTQAVNVVPDAASGTQSSVASSQATLEAGNATSTITVTARDATGNPVSGVNVTLTATGAGNTLVQPASVTDVNGVTTGTFNATGAGLKTISASVNGIGVTQSVQITVTPSAISADSSLLNAAPSSIVAGLGTSTVTATARDAFGNAIAGASVTLAASGAGNTFTQPASVTDANGVATGALASTTTGAKIVSAIIGAVVVTQTDTVTVTAGALSATLSTLSATDASIVAGGPATTVTVTARDANGNPIGGLVVVLAATGTGNTLTQPGSVTNASGVATGTLASTIASDKIITVTIGGTPIVQPDTVAVTAAAVSAATSTVSIAPTSVTAGAATSGVTVTARDAFGNVVAGATVSLAATGTGNTIVQPAVVTDANGVATGTIASTVAEAKTISATIGVTSITQTAALTVTAGVVSAAQSSLSAGSALITAGGGSSLVTITARDAFGNPIAGATVVLAASGTGNTITGPVSVTNASGVTLGAVSSTVAGEKIISATIAGTPITQTDTVLVTAGGVSAATSSVSTAPASIVAAGSGSTVTVTARDASGNAVANASVLITVTGAGNTVTQPGALTDVNGVATGSFTSTGAGEKVVSATIATTAVTQTDTVAVTAGAFSAAQSAVSAVPATLVAGVDTSTITVTARDANSNPIAGMTIALSATGTGNGFVQPVATTNALGVATGRFTSSVAGSKVVSATANGAAITQTAAVTVNVGAASAATSQVTVSPANITTDQSSTVTVQLIDAVGNLLASSGGTVVLATTVGSLTAVTDNLNGTYTALLTSTVPGVAAIGATIEGAPIVDSATVSIALGAASSATSEINVAPTSITTDDEATVTVVLRDAAGNALITSGGTLTLSSTIGTLSAITNNLNGTYTATLTSLVLGNATITGTINTAAIADNAVVTVTVGAASTGTSLITAAPASMTTDGSSTITVQLRDAAGNALTGSAGPVVALSTTLGALSTVNDIGNGTYTATLTSSGTGAATITGALNGFGIVDDAVVAVTAGAVSAAQSTVQASQSPIVAGSGTSTITVTARDAAGNVIAGQSVALGATGTGNLLLPANPLTTDLNGVASATFSSTVAQVKSISAVIGSTIVDQTAAITVTPGAAAQLALTTAAAGAASGLVFGTQPVVEIRDANGNVVTTDNSTVVTISAIGGASVFGSAEATAVSGIAGFGGAGLTGSAGALSLEYSSGILVSASQSITLSAGAGTQYLMTASTTAPVVGAAVTVTATDGSARTGTSAPITTVAALLLMSQGWLGTILQVYQLVGRSNGG